MPPAYGVTQITSLQKPFHEWLIPRRGQGCPNSQQTQQTKSVTTPQPWPVHIGMGYYASTVKEHQNPLAQAGTGEIPKNGGKMKISNLLLPAVVLVFFSGSSTIASEWHGIVPLHSTRSDVLRILGEPNSKYDRYLIDGEEADILYSRGSCLSGWNVPSDTVLRISVTFKQSPKLSDLKIDLDKYVRIRDPFVTTHVFYTNKEKGIRYEVFEGLKEKGTVLQVYYEPTSKDEVLLRCEKKMEVKIPDRKCVRERPLGADSESITRNLQLRRGN
jgi:hypothetical protein